MKTRRISPETSCRIANLGFVCTLLVIVIHIRNVPQEVGSLPWIAHFVVRNVFASVAVPFFFIVSGCFLGRHVGEPGWWRRALVQRMRTLGIPWFVWCLVPFLVFSVSVPATLGFLWTLTPTTRWSGLLVGNAFAIYVMHAPVIRTIHLLGLVPAVPFAAPLEWALVTLAAGTLAWIMRRCLPKSLVDLCFGGR